MCLKLSNSYMFHTQTGIATNLAPIRRILYAQTVRGSSPLSQFPAYGLHQRTSPKVLSRSKAEALYPDRSDDFGPRRIIC